MKIMLMVYALLHIYIYIPRTTHRNHNADYEHLTLAIIFLILLGYLCSCPAPNWVFIVFKSHSTLCLRLEMHDVCHYVIDLNCLHVMRPDDRLLNPN